MNSIDIIRAGCESYYLTLGKDDYYTGQPEPEGVFLGKGARRFKLLGQEIKEQDPILKQLFNGNSPDGKTVLRQGMKQVREYHTLIDPETKKTVKEPTKDNTRLKTLYLTRYEVAQLKGENPKHYSKRLQEAITQYEIADPVSWLSTKKSRSVVAYDNVFSAPKDVSILWSLSPDQETRAKILQIHERATRSAISFLEEKSYVRLGKGGVKSEKADATFAVFTHTTSRELDPQLHTHVVMLNIGITERGKTAALDGKRILDARYTAGMVYQNELRRGLAQSFGVSMYDQPFKKGRGVSFGIEGISKAIKDEFSKRTQDIKQRIEPGMSAKERRVEKLKGRKAKDNSVKSNELLEKWQERAKAQGFKWHKVIGKERPKALKSKKDYKLFYREVTSKLYVKENIQKGVSRQQVATVVLNVSRGRLTSKEAFTMTDGIKDEFFTRHVQKSGKILYTLNQKGEKARNYRTFFERLEETLKGLKRAKYLNRLAILYATGKISHQKYKKYTEGKGLPKSVIGIRVHQALGLINSRQAKYLLHKHKNPPRPQRANTKKHPTVKLTVFEPQPTKSEEPQR